MRIYESEHFFLRKLQQSCLKTKEMFSGPSEKCVLIPRKARQARKGFISALSRGQEAEYEWFFLKNNVELCTLIILVSPIVVILVVPL
jgi:hypothetical protein